MFFYQFGQSQGQQVSHLPKTIIRSIHCSRLKVKFRMIQKLLPSQEKHTDDADEDDDDDGTITPPVGGRHNELSI